MKDGELRRLFKNLVNCSLVSALAAPACGGSSTTSHGGNDLSGTGGESSSGGSANAGTGGGNGVPDGGEQADPFWPDLPQSDFAPPECDADASGGVELAHGLKPASAVDYVALELVSQVATSSAGKVIDSDGTACKTATKPSVCQALVADAGTGLQTTESCGGPPYLCQHFLLSTAGDTMNTWLPGPGYLEFLGAIDTPAEAILVVASNTYGGYWVECQQPTVRAVSDGYEVVALQLVGDCALVVEDRVLFHVGHDGTVTELRRNVASVSTGCTGRRTPGLVSRPEPATNELGDFFARIALLEAASVDAFRHLRAEIGAHGASDELLTAVDRAMDDEVRHADVTGALARRFGAEPVPARVEALPLRALEVIACENAVEGCVRETYGALCATYQARAATDATVADTMSSIAEDETRHAALSWQIAAWSAAQLSESANDRVSAARARGIADLRRELDVDVPDSLRTTAGVPPRAVALELLSGLERVLWS